MNWKKKCIFLAMASFLTTSLTLGSGPWTRAPLGTPIAVLALDPTNPSTLYAGGNGGLFRSTDMGANWVAITSGLTNTAVFALALDPTTPSTLYAGTRGGVFQSTDMGASWVSINNGLTDTFVLALALDPINPSILYAGTAFGGVFKSSNSGANWVAINNGPTSTAQVLAPDPTNPSTLYAGTSRGGVFRSTDSGANWVAINNGLIPNNIGNIDVRALALDPTDPSTLYAGTGREGMFRSTDMGANWAAIDDGLTNTFVRALTIDPTNSSNLYTGTLGGVFQSTDRGANWAAINNGLTDPPDLPQPNVLALAIDPTNPSKLYAGGNAGLFGSADMGASWAEIQVGLTDPGVIELALDPTNPSTLYAGTGGEGVFRSTDRGANWKAINNGLPPNNSGNITVWALAIDPTNPSTLYAGRSGGMFRSSDRGANWVEINSGLTTTPVRALAIDPTNPSTLYVGTFFGGVFKSTDMGANWAAINNGLTDPVVRTLALDPTNPSTLYAGTDSGRVFKSTDRGANWTRMSNGLTNGEVHALAIDPTNPSILYAGTSGGGVFKSTDLGANWTAINNGLTNTLVLALAIDPANPSTLYAGTNGGQVGGGSGVFRSTDSGASWEEMNNGLTNGDVNVLVLDPTYPSTLYAGTAGGVFSLTEESRWLYAAGTSAGNQAQFDALALTNFSDSEANLDLEAITPAAAKASVQSRLFQGNDDTASVILQSGQQTARLRTDLFAGDPSEPAWIELSSDTSEIGTFFQFGTDTLSQLDGGVAITQTSTRMVFTRVFDGPEAFGGDAATTRISILNPNPDAVTIELSYQPAGNAGAATQGTSSATRTIPGRSFLDERPPDLFGLSPLGAQLSGGVIVAEVTEGSGVMGFQLIQLTDQSTVLGLNAATGNSTNRAYSAQLASQPGLFTSVNVVNLGEEPRNVTLRAIQEDGTAQGDPLALVLGPGEQFTEDAGVLFGSASAGAYPAQGESFEGSLVVEADGDGVVGDVIFGDSTDVAYAASLPLQTEPFTEALFNQVANVSGFFTGLAFFYPGPSQGSSAQGPALEAEITIQVFFPGGEMAGESSLTLAAGERISQLVEEAELAGGYVRIFSTRAIIGQMLFGVIGPGGIQLFSAVPPTVVR